MCQKIINGIAIFSGVVSLTVVGTAGYVYVQKDAIIESVKERALKNIGGAAIGGLAGGAIKSLPGLPLPVGPQGPSLPVPGSPF
tara:strand:+ start:179 stop:430 length:252 start_codon:yes stop_codon:yes gene_type:complete